MPDAATPSQETKSTPTEHRWVKMIREHDGHAVGEKIELDTAEVKNSWIKFGVAEDCDAPSIPEDDIAKAVEDLDATIAESVAKHVKSIVGATTKAFGSSGNFPGIPAEPKDADEDARGGFKSFGEFAESVMKSSGDGASPTQKMASYITKAPQGLNVSAPSEGGFLVPETFSNELLQLVFDDDPILSQTRRLTTGANSIKIPGIDETSRATGSRQGGIRGYWLAEAKQITKSQPKFREVEMHLHKLAVLSYMTEEMMSDSGFNLESWLRMAMAKEINFLVGDSIVNGDGVGKPLGVLNAKATVSVGAEDGQSANTIIFDNIVNMWSRMYARSRANAIWLVNQDIEPQLATLSLPVGTGGVPAYLPAGGLSSSPYGSLMGRPVVPTEFNATLGTVGDIMLVDLSQYLSLTKAAGGIQTAMSMHLRFDYDELAFRATFRIAGQPSWHSALTPFKGTNTQSPFITLATRS